MSHYGNGFPVRISRNVLPRKSSSTHGSGGDIGMTAFLDPDCDTFRQVAQRIYRDHLDNLIPCASCGRKFFPDRVERHEGTCSAEPLKISSQKYKTVDKKGLRKVASTTGTPPASSSQITTKPTSILRKPKSKKIVKNVRIRQVGKYDDGYD